MANFKKLTAFHNVLAAARAYAKAEQEAEEEARRAERAARDPVSELYVYPADYSFLHIATLEEGMKQDMRPLVGGQRPSVRSDGRFTGRCLRLNNNQLTNVHNLHDFVQEKFSSGDTLAWLDLSYNCLKEIDEAILEYQNIQILYLHGNRIDNMAQVEKLSKLPKLWKLTLHGNKIDSQKDYRVTVLAMLPRLKNLDFSTVTRGESVDSNTLKSFNSSKKKSRMFDD